MARFKAKLWYEGELINEPVIATLARDHGVIANIRRANVEDDSGWIVCELEGNPDNLEQAIEWLRGVGVDVELVGDVVES
ncbi:ferredoxin [Acidimicrobium ferrooxidans DSM 10331]|uniref:Ferredoxin n=1 Tax=Acidimicrobium ferrooxidans (strain DSM 10331 / JCM 15462 / NBRC 103882 / ICP) TaxID=525909 RepID=C7M1A6_ACIFD|nr:NIL domain-containing protein [Acidimicrobium ferrooxidans]ACU54754.1 ferredoxin [Acidimicrobium ferrooxidans DSM 10331]